MWALRHGYRFLYQRAEPFPGRKALWNKMNAFVKVAEDRTCEVCQTFGSLKALRQLTFICP
jgi:hypothetical protein